MLCYFIEGSQYKNSGIQFGSKFLNEWHINPFNKLQQQAAAGWYSKQRVTKWLYPGYELSNSEAEDKGALKPQEMSEESDDEKSRASDVWPVKFPCFKPSPEDGEGVVESKTSGKKILFAGKAPRSHYKRLWTDRDSDPEDMAVFGKPSFKPFQS